MRGLHGSGTVDVGSATGGRTVGLFDCIDCDENPDLSHHRMARVTGPFAHWFPLRIIIHLNSLTGKLNAKRCLQVELCF